MARRERKVMADMRALEEEHERYNPVNPVRGRGATPSAGVSQFRGGARSSSPSSYSSGEDLEGGGFLSDLGIPILSPLAGAIGLGTGAGMLGQDGHGQRQVGAGTHKGQKRKTARRAYEGGMSEATKMGLHLGKHLHSLHGAGFFDDFKKGFMSVIGPVAGVAKSVLPLLGPEGMAASGVLGAVGLGTGAGRAEDMEMATRSAVQLLKNGASDSNVVAVLKKKPFHLSKKDAEEVLEDAKAAHGLAKMKRGGVRTGAYEGKGKSSRAKKAQKIGEMELEQHELEHEALEGSGFISDLGIPIISNLAGAIGLGREGCGKKKRAPAGPSDGRRARAEIVKKVMREKGMKMIDASKYVKEHGLY